MSTVKEVKEWLDRFPDDTIVEFAALKDNGIEFKTLDISDSDSGNGWDFLDFRNHFFVKPDAAHYGKCYLMIGEE